MIRAWVEIFQRIGRKRIDTNEAMADAIADKSQRRSIRRPPECSTCTHCMQQLGGCRLGIAQIKEPDLPIQHPGNSVTTGRKSGRIARAKLARRSAIERDQPY